MNGYTLDRFSAIFAEGGGGRGRGGRGLTYLTSCLLSLYVTPSEKEPSLIRKNMHKGDTIPTSLTKRKRLKQMSL